jgi:hypothetical protein
MKFREKSETVDAFQWTGGPDQTEDPAWIVDAIKAGTVYFTGKGSPDCMLMVKQKDKRILGARLNDWILHKKDGRIITCPRAIFEQVFEPADLTDAGGLPEGMDEEEFAFVLDSLKTAAGDITLMPQFLGVDVKYFPRVSLLHLLVFIGKQAAEQDSDRKQIKEKTFAESLLITSRLPGVVG